MAATGRSDCRCAHNLMETIMHMFFGLNDASTRRVALTAALLASALTTAAPAMASCTVPNLGAEVGNWWVNPVGNPTGFEVDYAGDVTGTIPAQITADPMTNAFAGLQLYNGSQVNPTTVNYDAGANLTRLIFSSQGALPNPVPGTWGLYAPDYYGTTYHYGENDGYQCTTPTPLTPVSKHWLYDDGTLQEVPYLHASWDGSFAKGTKGESWAAVYFEAQDHSTGGWQLVDVIQKPGKPVKINLTNGSQAPITIGIAGYELGLTPPNDPDCVKSPQCAANQAALEKLNEVGMPVPGQPNSPFTALKVSKKPIAPGKTITLTLR
jgi:hypothetical protein